MLPSGRKIRNAQRMPFSSEKTCFRKYAEFSASFFISASENNFFRFSIKKWVPTSCQIEYRSKTRLVVALRIVSTMMRIGRFCKPIEFFYVNDRVNLYISFCSTYHLSSNNASFFFLFFPSSRKIEFAGVTQIFGHYSAISDLKMT